ncbi:MAG: HD domain-containing protein [Coriobacteriia bacterium]|nr:HD domain-containing protein [Coriobacteriia bacterium]
MLHTRQLRKFNKCALKYNLYQEFLSCIDDLISHPEVQKMADFPHHGDTNTFDHVLSVSYYTFYYCKKLKLDYRAGARAGLLHDLFLYDWHTQEEPKLVHTFNHPLIALENARKYFELSEREEEMITMHMYPMVKGLKKPKFKETHIIALVDKLCAVSEVMHAMPKLVERRLEKIALGEAYSEGLIAVERA